MVGFGPDASAKRSDRMVRILALLSDQGDASLTDLAQQLNVSAATIRRDVAALADQHLLVRTHGGARSLADTTELPERLRNQQSKPQKQAIARLVAKLLPSSPQLLALCGGTTSMEVLRSLRHRSDLTIVTNSLTIGLEAANLGQSRVLMTGGVLRANSLELVGNLAESTFRHVAIDTAILGTGGISAATGATTHDEVEARTNAAMVRQAKRVIVVADGSKVGRKNSAPVAPAKEIDVLVTDDSANPNELRNLQLQGVRVHVAKSGR